MLVKTGVVPPALLNPETTGTKRLRDFLAPGRVETGVQPGLNVSRLKRRYSLNAYAPRAHDASFKVPIGATESQLAAYAKEAGRRFIEHMGKLGWDVCTSHKLYVYQGVYPAVDTRDGLPLLDQRDYHIRGWFRCRKPEPIRTELRPELLEPIKASVA